ncbi:KTSC domain-containing protein [Pedobacter sp. JY14-1]|uniref:KTSC domain-containing protein n=1 Tax=Pedobacter sp. JY14-1 TaxID=3034151 RepID=UPI0023E17940|nr:KTSC domain-containing protein [Pedobacter sp. JY14-1]
MPSTVIDKFFYDADRRWLTVIFRSGKTYRYIDVPQDVYLSLGASISKGRYFNRKIRNVYSYKSLED